MDIQEEFKNIEKVNQQIEESHAQYMEAIKPILRNYIANSHFKKGDHISKFYETDKKVADETNDILEYIDNLYQTSQLNFKYAKILNEKYGKN